MESIPAAHPDDLGRGPMIAAVTWVFTILSVLAVALRMYVRLKVSKFCASEDWIMVVAVIFQVATQALLTVSYQNGMGKHDANLEQPTQFVTVLKWNWITEVPGLMVSILARISITILLVRLFGVHTWFKWFIITLTAIQTIVDGLIIPFTFCQVKPTEALWNVYLTDVQRWDPRIVLYMDYVGQSLCTFSDITYVLFPVMIIWRLNMPTQRKVGLVLLMAGSLLTAAMSIVKTVLAQRASVASADAQYTASLEVLWCTLEETMVIIMGCIPTLRAITKLNFPSLSALSASLRGPLRRSRSKTLSPENGDSSSGYRELEDLQAGQMRLDQPRVTDGPAI